jgi:hypothetical protein
MKRFSLAAVVFATTLVVAPPSALCDSFGYRTSGSRIGLKASFDTGREGVLSGFAESGTFTNTELSNTGGSNNGGALGYRNAERSVNGAFLFDRVLKGGAKGGQQDNSGVLLVDLNDGELVLLSGNDGGGAGSGGKNGQFLFADRGRYTVSNELQRGNSTIRSNTAALTVTPEPGSLFLLGTGLLGLALVLFWKAAKRPTGS